MLEVTLVRQESLFAKGRKSTEYDVLVADLSDIARSEIVRVLTGARLAE